MSKFLEADVINYLPFLLKDYRANIIGLLNKYGYNLVRINSADSEISKQVILAKQQNVLFSNDLDVLIQGSLDIEHNYLKKNS